MNRCVILSCLLLVGSASAQDDFYAFEGDNIELSPFSISSVSNRAYDPRYRGSNRSETPIRLKIRADVVTLRLTISSDEKRADRRIAALQDAFAQLRDSAEERDDILMRSGYVELPLVTDSRWWSSAKGSDDISSFNITLLAKMGPTDTVFDRTAVLNDFVENIDLPSGVKALFVSSGIALLNPASYREQLLHMLANELEMLRGVFGVNTEIQLNGLDRNVQVAQLDEANLELSLPYNLVAKTKGVEVSDKSNR